MKSQRQVTKGHENFQVTNRSCDTSFLINFDQGIRLLCPLDHVKLFSTVHSEGQVKVGPVVQLVGRWNPRGESTRPGYKSPGFEARRTLDVYGPPGGYGYG